MTREVLVARRFGPGFVAEQRARFGGLSPERRPLTYDIAVEPQSEARRAWYDEQLALLPQEHADKLAGRLWDDRWFWPVTFELAVGAALRRAGYTVAYDRPCGTQTPDWTVLDRGGEPAMFVEVHTDQPPDGTYKRLRAWRGLEVRIAEIPCPVVLMLDSRGVAPRAPDQKSAKQIAVVLRKRLLSGPILPSRIEACGYVFVVRSDMNSTLGMRAEFRAPSGVAGPVSARKLTERVDGKVATYAAIAQKHDVPLVVAVGAHRFTGVDLSDVDDLLAGRLTVKFQFNGSDSYIGRQSLDWGRPYRWTMPAELSGLLWISNEDPFPIAARPNPAAARPVPLELGSAVLDT